MKPSYYMKSLQYYLELDKKFKQNSSQTNYSQVPMAEVYKQHFLQSIAAFKFVAKLRIPTDAFMTTIKV